MAFSEPVTCSSATLTNSWGTLNYNSGSGSNVLTFKGTIGANVSGALNITGWSGTIKDLAGNPFVGSLSQSSLASFTCSIAYNISCDLAGGELPDGSTPNPTTYTYDSNAITLTNPVRTGYTFAGWSGTGFSGTRTTVTIPIHSHGDRAYTAHWTPIAYAISYVHATNGVDGVVNANPTSYTIEDGIASLADPTRTDYFFCGWYENPGLTGSPVSGFSAATLGDRTFYAKWITVPWDGSGTDDDPYIISTREELDALAACINAHADSSRRAYYRLDADIAYDPAVTNSFTPIGDYSSRFRGTFDGNGHTISGISISRPNTNYQGLFGFLAGATVMNLTLTDSSIEGRESIGGIAGMSDYSHIQKCFVIGTTLSGGGYIGAIVGFLNDGTLSSNAYHGCVAVVDGSTSTSNISTGDGDAPGANQCCTLAFAEGIAPVTAPDFSFPVYGTNYSYYAAYQRVTVRAAAGGYVIANVRVNGSAATDNGDGTFSFTMPDADATVTADLEALPAIPYIDAGGEPQVCSNYYTVIASAAADVEYGTSGAESWYAVTNDVNISGMLHFDDLYAHLIVCDGATLTITNENGNAIEASDDNLASDGNLVLYGRVRRVYGVQSRFAFWHNLRFYEQHQHVGRHLCEAKS